MNILHFVDSKEEEVVMVCDTISPLATPTAQLPSDDLNASIISGVVVGSTIAGLLTLIIVLLVLLIVRRSKTKTIILFANDNTNTNTSFPICDGKLAGFYTVFK